MEFAFSRSSYRCADPTGIEGASSVGIAGSYRGGSEPVTAPSACTVDSASRLSLKISRHQKQWVKKIEKLMTCEILFNDYRILDLFRVEPCFHSWFNCHLEYQKGRNRRTESSCREVWYFRRSVGSHFFRPRDLLHFALPKQLTYTSVFPKCRVSSRHQRSGHLMNTDSGNQTRTIKRSTDFKSSHRPLRDGVRTKEWGMQITGAHRDAVIRSS